MILLNRMNRKSLINIIKFSIEYPRMTLNSLIRNLNIMFQNIINREGISQN